MFLEQLNNQQIKMKGGSEMILNIRKWLKLKKLQLQANLFINKLATPVYGSSLEDKTVEAIQCKFLGNAFVDTNLVRHKGNTLKSDIRRYIEFSGDTIIKLGITARELVGICLMELKEGAVWLTLDYRRASHRMPSDKIEKQRIEKSYEDRAKEQRENALTYLENTRMFWEIRKKYHLMQGGKNGRN